MIVKRGNRYALKLTTPKRIRTVDARRTVWIALKTDSLKEARILAPLERARQERVWAEMLGQPAPAINARVIALAAELGHDYREASELRAGPVADVIRRALALPSDAAPGDARTLALLGGVERPRKRLSDMLAIEEEARASKLRRMNADQIRVFRSARARAVKEFIAAAGDIPIESITSSHATKLRNHLDKRVVAGEVIADSANKTITLVAAVYARVAAELGLKSERPFEGKKLETEKRADKEREAMPAAWITGLVLNDERMAGLNDEARDILRLMVDTGCRPSEIIGLRPEDILLGDPVPHFVLVEGGRLLKTEASLRKIPVFGRGLKILWRNPGGFPRYRGKPTSWSNLTNKYLRNAGLPEPFTAYGIRHDFADRINRPGLGLSQRDLCDLMGHKFEWERYGRMTLEEKRAALIGVAYP